MSAIPCPVCGQLRKVEQISTEDGWLNGQCYSCGDPGWVQPYGEEDPLAGRVAPSQLPRCVDCGRPMPTGQCTLTDCFSTWGKTAPK